MARHRNGIWWTRWPFVTSTVVLLTATTTFLLLRLDGSGETTAGGCPSGSHPVIMGVDPVAGEWVTDVVSAYNSAHRQLGGVCALIKVSPLTLDQAEAALKATPLPSGGTPPDIWLPQSSSTVDLLRGRQANTSVLPDAAPSIASSPLVLAAPEAAMSAIATRTGGGAQFTDFLSLTTDSHGWAALGHPEWGMVRLSMADPTSDMTGIGILEAVAASAASVPLDKLTDQTFRSGSAQAGLRGLPHALTRVTGQARELYDVAHGMASGTAVMRSLGIIVSTEQQLHRYNDEGDGVPLVAAYPFGGNFAADFPVVSINGSWVDGFAHRAARDFVAWTAEPAQSGLLAKWGLRQPDGSVGAMAAASHGLSPATHRPVHGPRGVVSSAFDLWTLLSRPKSILEVYDTSARTAIRDPRTGLSRLDTVRQAALNALSYFQPKDQVGLWEFSANLDGTKPYREIAPLAPLSTQRDGRTHLDAVRAGIQGLTPHAGTGLYDTILAAYLNAQRLYVPGAVNSVGLVTTSPETDPNGLTRTQLIDELVKHRDPQRAVRLVLIGVGPDINVESLTQIANAVDGVALTADNVSDVSRLFEEGYLAMVRAN